MKTLCYKNRSQELPNEEDYIYVNEFNEENTRKFHTKFVKLSLDKNIKVIVIIINSYGGEVYSLLSMIDLIKTAEKPVCTISNGKAISCGAVLLSCGTKGYRYAGELSDIMIHEASQGDHGKNTDIQNSAEQLKKLNDMLMRILAENSGKKNKNFFIKMLKKKSNVDMFLTAVECKKLGLIDHVGTPKLLVE